MLSWASNDQGAEVDLTAIAEGSTHNEPIGALDGRLEMPHAAELLAFATACGRTDDQDLERTRERLIKATGSAFMVDAAAVAANFEMMTRLADGTGARMPSEIIEQRAAVVGAMGVAELTSRR